MVYQVTKQNKTNMKLCTWNVNGIRAIKEPLASVIQKLDANLICFQETKVTSKLVIRFVSWLLANFLLSIF
jgi:hypothetical protein